MSEPTTKDVIAAMRPARRGGFRRLTFDNGRHEDYDSVFVSHPGGEWDRILIARDAGSIAEALAALINGEREAEAVAAERARITVRLAGLEWALSAAFDNAAVIDRAAVLAIVNPEADHD